VDIKDSDSDKDCKIPAICRTLGSGEQTRIESCIIWIPESMVESHYSSPNLTWTDLTEMYVDYT
jgi:hypothetical protein